MELHDVRPAQRCPSPTSPPSQAGQPLGRARADEVARAPSRFAAFARVEVTTPLLNGAVAARIDPGGAFDEAIAFVVEDGRITRMYAMRNPHKFGRVDAVAELRR